MVDLAQSLDSPAASAVMHPDLRQAGAVGRRCSLNEATFERIRCGAPLPSARCRPRCDQQRRVGERSGSGGHALTIRIVGVVGVRPYVPRVARLPIRSVRAARHCIRVGRSPTQLCPRFLPWIRDRECARWPNRSRKLQRHSVHRSPHACGLRSAKRVRELPASKTDDA